MIIRRYLFFNETNILPDIILSVGFTKSILFESHKCDIFILSNHICKLGNKYSYPTIKLELGTMGNLIIKRSKIRLSLFCILWIEILHSCLELKGNRKGIVFVEKAASVHWFGARLSMADIKTPVYGNYSPPLMNAHYLVCTPPRHLQVFLSIPYSMHADRCQCIARSYLDPTYVLYPHNRCFL